MDAGRRGYPDQETTKGGGLPDIERAARGRGGLELLLGAVLVAAVAVGLRRSRPADPASAPAADVDGAGDLDAASGIEPVAAPVGPLAGIDAWQRGHALVAFPVGVLKKFGDDRAGRLAALVAYYGFFSLFPLLLVAVTVIGYLFGNEDAERLKDSALSRSPSSANRSTRRSRASAAAASPCSSACHRPVGRPRVHAGGPGRHERDLGRPRGRPADVRQEAPAVARRPRGGGHLVGRGHRGRPTHRPAAGAARLRAGGRRARHGGDQRRGVLGELQGADRPPPGVGRCSRGRSWPASATRRCSSSAAGT